MKTLDKWISGMDLGGPPFWQIAPLSDTGGECFAPREHLYKKRVCLTMKRPETSSRGKIAGQNPATGLLPFERASKIILMSFSDNGFGEDLMCENFVQKGLRLRNWRTPCLAAWRPMESQRRVLRTTWGTPFCKGRGGAKHSPPP